MSMLIQHNMLAWNAERQFNITTKEKNKKTEKLSSGYRINRAADDAAGLSISEKMRRQIRGLKVGTENAQMGVSWVQIGEGALNEAHDILHRMNELSIKAQNGTNTLVDRAYMQAEFEQLQSELDRISTTTTFNELNIFEEHEPVYDQICGNKQWDYEEYHEIMDGRNQLIVEYYDSLAGDKKELTLTVPPGRYTTHELIDELDTAAGIDGPIHMEFTEKGFCRLNLESGEYIDTVTGDLAYLLWDNYDGGGYGALIGTTVFQNPNSDKDTVNIVRGVNDKMTFDFQYFEDGKTVEGITIDLSKDLDTRGRDEYRYTKTELMQIIDDQINDPYKRLPENAVIGAADTGVKTSHYGTSIMLSSDLGIVTGFKGNMFTIDGDKFTSVFYDNIQHGRVKQEQAAVVGAPVLTTDTRDKEHNRFYIDGTNDTLVLQPNLMKSPTEIKITHNTTDGYTAQKMVDELNQQFVNEGIDGEVVACLVQYTKRELYPNGDAPTGDGTATKESVGDDQVLFEGVEIRTVKQGPDAIVNLAKVKDANGNDTNQVDKTLNTAYDTLFTVREFNIYGGTATDAVVSNHTRDDTNANVTGSKQISSVTIGKNNNSFVLTLSSANKSGGTDFKAEDYVITVDNGTYKSAAALATAINKAIANSKDNKDGMLQKRVFAEATDDGRICIRDMDDKTDKILDDVTDPYLNWATKIELSSYGGNAGYRTIFQREFKYNVPRTESWTLGNGKSHSFTVPGGAASGNLTIYVDGKPYEYSVNGKKPSQMVTEINEEERIVFDDVTGQGFSSAKSFTVSGQGTTRDRYWAGGTAKGDSGAKEGLAGLGSNTPAQLEIGPELKSSMEIETGKNDLITLTLNGKTRTLTISPPPPANPGDSVPTKWTYTQAQLVEALQTAIDDEFGDGMGGALVEVKNSRLHIISRLPSREDGAKTSIAAAAQGEAVNTFFDSLWREETAASCASKEDLQSNITLANDGVSDQFSFTFTDSSGTNQTITLDLVGDADSENIGNGTALAGRIMEKIKGTAAEGRVEAVESGGKLVLRTIEKGDHTEISFGSGNSAASAALYGTNPTTAQITLNQTVKASATFNGTKDFCFELDGRQITLKIGSWADRGKLNKQFEDALKAQGLDSQVAINVNSSGTLTIKKKTAGGQANGQPSTLHMSYADSDSDLMKAMFGVVQKPTMPGIEVSGSDKNNTFTITNKSGHNVVITMSSDTSGGMVAPEEKTGYEIHSSGPGWHDAEFSSVTSNKLDANGIEFTRWNNDLEFFLQTDSDSTKKTGKTFKYTFAEGLTSLADIQKTLQDEMDKQLGKDEVKVTLTTDNRLVFTAGKPGSQRQFKFLQTNEDGTTQLVALQSRNSQSGEIGGGFYHHVMCGYTPPTDGQRNKVQFADRTDVNGEQWADKIFAQGRHDVVTDLTHLQAGVSDTLYLDLNFTKDVNDNGIMEDSEKAAEQMITIKIDLPPHEFAKEYDTGEQLRKRIQEALDKAIESKEVQDEAKKLGVELHKGLIDVNLGKYDTQVVGNRDKVAISFSITENHDIATPVEGWFYIDGIRGNAAYETFYRTDGELIPAFIIGTKDITKGVTLGPNDTELKFTIDGEEKTVKLDPGKYTAKELVNALKKAFEEQQLPLGLEITTDGFLKISHNRMGRHTIEKITGSARNEIFFQEHVDKRPSNEREIRISSFEGDRLSVYSPRFSTSMLHINSLCLSQVKYAEKATNRLKEAIGIVSEMRNTFGAIQNRFEHTINNNLNKHENLQAAESRIRDADISKEMMEFSNLSIIQQAGQAVLAQANQSRQGMLSLLQ